MSRPLESAVVLTALPLCAALAALVLREIQRPVPATAAPTPVVTEYVPPLALLAAARAPSVAGDCVVDGARSTAIAIGAREGLERRLLVSGSVRLLADDSLAGLELDLALPAGAPANGWPPDLLLHLRGAGAQGRVVPLPGVRAADVRCSIALGGVAHEAVLAATWIRLPGGDVELHGVVRLESSRLDLLLASRWRMLTHEDVSALGIDLVLRAQG
ncbi:MAG: hypothetical protein JNK02_16930 [Planctomycetes bacterium]|nr:hypothetical protein [Planctomycetota bacterium]